MARGRVRPGHLPGGGVNGGHEPALAVHVPAAARAAPLGRVWQRRIRRCAAVASAAARAPVVRPRVRPKRNRAAAAGPDMERAPAAAAAKGRSVALFDPNQIIITSNVVCLCLLNLVRFSYPSEVNPQLPGAAPTHASK